MEKANLLVSRRAGVGFCHGRAQGSVFYQERHTDTAVHEQVLPVIMYRERLFQLEPGNDNGIPAVTVFIAQPSPYPPVKPFYVGRLEPSGFLDEPPS